MEYVLHKGLKIPMLGFGTWCIGDNEENRKKEIETIRYAVEEYGITLIDTAEMYGLGKSENVVAEAIRSIDRDKLYIVDKILPENAMAGKYEERVRNSLNILGIDYFDLYLLHWRSGVDLQSMVDEMERLKALKLIRNWGVSNFDVKDMKELLQCRNGNQCFANQVLYNIDERGIEFDLISYCKQNNILLMAYSVVGNSREYQDKILASPALQKVAAGRGVHPFNILIKFVTRNKDLIALVKTSSKEHLDQNMKDFESDLTEAELEVLEQDFPKPVEKIELHKI